MKRLYNKYKELILYIIFGVATTAVNLVVYYILLAILGDGAYAAANAIAWVAGVLFAYFTNKLIVFESKSWQSSTALREAAEFVAARLFSLAVEELGLIVLIQYGGFDTLVLSLWGLTVTGPKIAKLIFAVVVVILNYIFSKLFIFAKPKK